MVRQHDALAAHGGLGGLLGCLKLLLERLVLRAKNGVFFFERCISRAECLCNNLIFSAHVPPHQFLGFQLSVSNGLRLGSPY